MSAKIYGVPKNVKLPEMDFANFDNQKWLADEAKFKNDLRADIKSKGYTGKHSGEIIKFPVADGYAEYMVLQMRPLMLIHLPIMDAYQFQYVHLLTAKEVNEKIRAQKSLEAFFAENRKKKANLNKTK